MGRGILLWLLGVPIPVIILLWLFFGHLEPDNQHFAKDQAWRIAGPDFLPFQARRFRNLNQALLFFEN